MTTANWESGVPGDDWILSAPLSVLRDWILLRASGSDGHWTWRQGEPLDLLYALVRHHSVDVQAKVIRGVAAALQHLRSDPGDVPADAARALIDLAGACGSEGPYAEASLVADALTSLLDAAKSSQPAEYLAHLLGARARVAPRPPARVWTEYLEWSSPAVVTAAFQGILLNESEDAAMDAFTRLLHVARQHEMPHLTAQAMSLQERVGEWKFARYLGDLEDREAALADIVAVLARKLEIGLLTRDDAEVLEEDSTFAVAGFNSYYGPAE